MRSNPFHELYVTESYPDSQFVDLFSDQLVEHTLQLYRPGHFVLKGLPGTGKTMMLSLLKPSIRLAYAERGKDFPLPTSQSKFIGAGINLIKNSVSDFSNLAGAVYSIEELSLMFGDFLNFYVIRDILRSIELLHPKLGGELGIHLDAQRWNRFSRQLSGSACWFGGMSGVKDRQSLLRRLDDRTETYRAVMNLNQDLPTSIAQSKTSIGVPVSETVRLLKETGILEQDTEVYVRIDQYEELSWLDQRLDNLGGHFQSMINKLLANRDSQLSYKIGSRTIYWEEGTKKIFGTEAELEEDRNYLSISIDEVLKRKEKDGLRKKLRQESWLFPRFADDIFAKRISVLQDTNVYPSNTNLDALFGESLSPKAKAMRYISKNPHKSVTLDKDWSDTWKSYLRELAEHDPFDARLAEAWVRQKDKGALAHQRQLPNRMPWHTTEAKWWRKERMEMALIQLASRNQQQLIWSGTDDIIALSGGNILAFLKICQCIWEVWRRDRSVSSETDRQKVISDEVQTLGVLAASNGWMKQRIRSYAGGKARLQFVELLGAHLYKGLIDDKAMSYPGANGFSISKFELREHPVVASFLDDACDYGVLVNLDHTTKSSNRLRRTKYYLHPLLSPAFKINVNHIKEPIYLTMPELTKLLVNSGAIPADSAAKRPPPTRRKAKTAGPRASSKNKTLFD